MEVLNAPPHALHHRKIDLKQDVRGATLESRENLAQGGRAGDEDVICRSTHLNGAGIAMPGILGVAGESKVARTYEGQETQMEVKDVSVTVVAEEVPQLNGNHPSTDAIYANGTAPAPHNLHRETMDARQKIVGQLPPEIEHWTTGYVPMSRLIRRLVQETFNGLGDVVNDMAEFTDSRTAQPRANGVFNHINHRIAGSQPGDTSQGNVQRKLRMFEFANCRRAQFIKLLVLARWAGQSEAISRVIDLRIWLSQKEQDYNSAISWMGELKRKLAAVKEPNPDIDTALEVLSLGKVSWLPNLEYLPPEQLLPQQILAGLRRINTLLSIRLNIHENVPPILRDFSISSGRATFRFPKEFEIDLSIADEDHSQQLYFIEFRPKFSPAPIAFPAGRLREEFEARANDALSRGGLQSLFDFMHNLVLTHKLTILRNQAFEMARSYWSGHTRVEPVRRSVVLQYWCDRPGGKNWIEVGIRRGKARRSAHAHEHQRIPDLALRWFRCGKEVLNVKIDLRSEDISMEYILKQIIAQHTNYTFSEIAAKLSRGLLYSTNRLRLQRRASTVQPADASLLVQVTVTKAIKVIQEPVSGRFAVLPASSLNSRMEHELNRLTSPARDGSTQISYLRAVASQEEVATCVRRTGWQLVRSLLPAQETVQRLFTKGTQCTKFYRRDTWSKAWVLAFTTSLDGDCWWIVELTDQKSTANIATSMINGPQLRAAFRIMPERSAGFIMEPSQANLAQVEREAAGVVSQLVDTRQLAKLKIPHKVQSAPSMDGYQRSKSTYVRLLTRHVPPILHSPNPLVTPWANEFVKVDYRGMNATHSAAVNIASARLNQPLSTLKVLGASIPGAAFHRSSGAIAVRLQSGFGETSIPDVIKSMSAIERLRDFTATLKAHRLMLNSTSLDRLEFTYQQSPTILKAIVHFPADASLQISFPSPNPHLRILDHLNRILQREGFTKVLAYIRLSLPLLSCLANLESTYRTSNMYVLVHSEQSYRIRFAPPSPSGCFDIQLRRRRDDLYWLIADSSIKRSEPFGDESKWQQSLKEVTRGRGEGWRGMNGGIVARWDGIEEPVKKLHDVFSGATRDIPDESRPLKRKADDDELQIDGAKTDR